MIYVDFIKRPTDFIVSLLLLLLLSPVLIILVILGRWKFGKVFYFDARLGYKNKVFYVFKLKTMTDESDAAGNVLPDDKRLTKYGRFIRSLSLDELPQLINVIKGDMSLIGPRPLFSKYLHLYSKMQKRRHEVRPGITGWAQVNGRNSLSWSDKFKHDVYYVDHQSLKLDFKIFFMTIKKVLLREGVSSTTCATMDPFRGNVDES